MPEAPPRPHRCREPKLGIAEVDIGEPRGKVGGERREVVDRHVVLARRGAKRKEPLLCALQLGRVEFGGAHRRLQPAPRLLQMVERSAESCDRRLEQARRLRRLPLQASRKPDKLGERRRVAADELVRLVEIAGDLLGAHEELPPLGERRLLARFRRKRLKLRYGGAQVIGVAVRRFQRGTQLGRLRLDLAQRAIAGGYLRGVRLPAVRTRRAGGDAPPRRPARGRRAGRGSRPATRRAPSGARRRRAGR